MSKKKIGIVSGLFVLFLVIALLVGFNMTGVIDTAVYNFVISFRCDALDSFFKTITNFGDEMFIVGLVIAVVVVLRNKWSLLYGCLAIDCALTNWIVKHIVRRARPDVLKLVVQGGYSFPSGHTMIATCMYGYLIYAVNKKFTNKYLKFGTIFLLGCLIILVGLSRVYVGVHYFTDVIAGYILALIILVLYIELTEKYFSRGD